MMPRSSAARKAKGAPKNIKRLADLRPDPNNANKGTERGLGMLDHSLRQYGAGRSILVDRQGFVLAGNKTLERAADLGLEVEVVRTRGDRLVVVQREDLDIADKRARELAIADNRVAQVDLAWDVDTLKALAADGADLSAFFLPGELDALLEPVAPKAGKTDPDDVPAPRATSIKAGDLFELGKHRLLCGDSTKAEDVARLMGGRVASLIYTDPPYGVDYDGGTKVRAKLSGDSDTKLYGPACAMAASHSSPSAALYLWHAGVKGIAAAAAAAAAGYEIRCEIVWNKNQAQFGALSAQYKQKHEPCYYCFKRGSAPSWYGPTNETTVWDCDRSPSNDYHPTQKPVALAERAMRNSSTLGDVVLDLFLGSGATLIGAQTLDRRCFAIEIEPSYVQVAIDRWEAFTGQKAVKVADSRPRKGAA